MAQPDTSIYNMLGRGVKSVAEYDNDHRQGELNQLNLLSAREDMAGKQRATRNALALEDAYKGFGADPTQNANLLYQRGQGGAAQGYLKAVAELDGERAKTSGLRATAGKTEADADKVRLEAAIAKQAQIAQAARTATDQASWDRGLALVRSLGVDVSNIPTQFDPAFAKQVATQAMTGQQQLEQEWKAKEYSLDLRQQGEVERNNRVQTATTIRGQDLTNARGVEANGLKAQEIAGNADSGGAVLGVPRPTITPWANQSNSKDQNKVKLAEVTRGSKEIEKDADAARKEATTAQAAARFMELNKKVGTGGVADKVGVGRWVQSLGSDYAELESITARLAPAMREPGSGSTSDFDGKQFERATVGVDKPLKTNENIAKAIIARSQQSQDYADFRQTYLEQNGTLSGADRYWKQYADKNPIFDQSKPGAIELNAARKPWRDHFATATQTPGPAAAQRPPAGAAQPADPKGRPSLDSFNRN